MSLTLKEAIKIALSNNLKLRNADLSQRAAISKTFQLRTSKNAQLTAASVGSQQVFASQNLTSGVSYNDVAVEIQYSKMLLPSRDLRHDIFQATKDEEKAHLQQALTWDDVILETKSLYWRILTLSQLRTFQNAQVERYQGVNEATKTRGRLGFGNPLDMKWSSVQLGLSQDALLETDSGIRSAEIQLTQMLGLPKGQDFILIDGLPSVKTSTCSIVQKSMSLNNSAELRMAEKDVDKAEESRQYAKRRWWPDILFSGGYNLPDGRAAWLSIDNDWNLALLGHYPLNRDFPITYPSNYSVSFRCSLPLYDGNRAQANGAYGGAQLEVKRNEWAIAQDNLKTHVEQELQSLQSLDNRVRTLRDLTALSFEGSKAAQVKYTQGVISLMDLAKVESDDTEAERKYLEAFYDFMVAAERLKKDLLLEEYSHD